MEKQAHSSLFYEAKETGREKWAKKRHFATFFVVNLVLWDIKSVIYTLFYPHYGGHLFIHHHK